MSSTVEIGTGKLEGTREGGVSTFRGIPFARPPVGPLRFGPPVAPEPWSGVRDATQFGPAAPQTADLIGPAVGIERPTWGEECLTVNVWTPATDGGKRPVLVWIHGGAFVIGGGSQPICNGATLALRGDVVVVTINYRLGILGFLRLLDTALGGDIPTTGNEGLLDQIAALEWVQREIARFGGDPDNVTIFGESAGSISCSLLLIIARARGLFHKAILQSGSPNLVGTPALAHRVAEAVLTALEPEGGAAIRELPIARLLRAQGRVLLGLALETRGMPFRPNADGELIPTDPFAAIREGAAADVPLLVGTTRDEMKLFSIVDPESRALDEETLLRRCERNVPGRGQALIDGYRAARLARGEGVTPADLWFAIESDRMFRAPAMRLAALQSGHQPRTYAYCFTWESPWQGGVLGAAHALDIPFVFGTHSHPPLRAFAGEGPPASALAGQMQDAWLAFARHGDPSHAGLPPWPAYDAERRATMLLGPRCEAADAPWEPERRLWDGIDR